MHHFEKMSSVSGAWPPDSHPGPAGGLTRPSDPLIAHPWKNLAGAHATETRDKKLYIKSKLFRYHKMQPTKIALRWLQKREALSATAERTARPSCVLVYLIKFLAREFIHS